MEGITTALVCIVAGACCLLMASIIARLVYDMVLMAIDILRGD